MNDEYGPSNGLNLASKTIEINPDSVLGRVIAIEARQRAYGQHDPSCEVYVQWADRSGLAYVDPAVCSCWLSAAPEPRSPTQFRMTVGDGKTTQFRVPHRLGTYEVVMAVYWVETGTMVWPPPSQHHESVDSLTIDMGDRVAPANGLLIMVVRA